MAAAVAVGVALLFGRHLLGRILLPGEGDLALCIAAEEQETENEMG